MIVDMQLPEPVTGKVWKLEDFESYPALLVSSRTSLLRVHRFWFKVCFGSLEYMYVSIIFSISDYFPSLLTD